MSDTSVTDAPPVFGADGRMQGNMTSSQGQPPAAAPPGPDPATAALSPQSPLSAMGQPPAPPKPPAQQSVNYPAMPQMGEQQKVPPAPDAKEYRKHAMAFASAFAVLGAVAGRFARVPGGAALSAFAGSMNGWHEGNLEAYETAAKKWEADSKTAIENNKQVMDKYKVALENRKMNIDEQMSQIQLISAQYHDQMMYDAAASKNYTLAVQIYEKNREFTAKGEDSRAKLLEKRDEQKTKNEQSATYWMSPAGQGELEAVKPDGTPKYSEAQKAGVKQMIDIYAQKAQKGGETGHLVAKENKERADRGQPPMTAAEEMAFNQKSHQPRSAAGMSVQKFMQEHPDATSDEIQQFVAKQAEMSSGARTKGTREANLDIILRVTDSAIPAALAASEKVPRGKWVPLNQLIQGGQVRSSDTNLMQFGMANLQLAEGWARAMNPTGVMRESDRDKALSFLSTATSAETYKALVEQLRVQIQRERAAINSGTKDTISAPGESPGVSESTGEGWTDLGNGVRIREKR
jgi:hypothetical protein